MDYLHQLCDGCHRPLLPGEDVVVCPDCGTPQHRACYEQNHACVNAEKHETGFLWQADILPAPKAQHRDDFICPVCGAHNPVGTPECMRCGQRFEAQPNSSKPAVRPRDIRALFPEIPQEFDDEIGLDDAQYDAVCDSLLQRAAIAAPGMTPGQAEEEIAGHPIRQVMTFVASKPLVYINKFRALRTRRFTWNWAAFFFTPYWFFYRKLYKPGIVFLTLRACLEVLMLPLSIAYTDAAEGPMTALMQAFQSNDSAALQTAMDAVQTAASPFLWKFALIAGAMVLLSFFSGLLADRLYCRHVKHTLDEIKKAETRESFLLPFIRRSSVSVLALALSYAFISLLPYVIQYFFN